jgi:hypothetical protein
MKRLVEFPLDEGGSVLIEVDELPAGPVTRGLGKDRAALVEEADKSFEEATVAVTLAARSLIARSVRSRTRRMRLGIVFGLQLSDRRVHRLGGGASELHGVDDLAPQGTGNLNGQPCKGS